MRKLASIQEITELHPILNADAIEVAKVLGWHVVVKKDEFKVGDKVIYVEIDSILPQRSEFEFMAARHYRVKTIKLRGQVSQGICFPLSILPVNEYFLDDDVTEILDITKYEPMIPASLSGMVKGNFPSFLMKTDETRVQNLQGLLTSFKDTPCYVTEKIDGSSCTFYIKDNEFGVCSRNIDLKETEGNAFWQMARKLDIEERMRAMGFNFAIQGELFGPGIQGNKYKATELQVRFFNAFDIDEFKFLDFDDFINLVCYDLDLYVVPVIDDSYLLVDDIDAIVEYSKGNSVICSSTKREGIVIRPTREINTHMGRMSFKAINPDFLLKYDE